MHVLKIIQFYFPFQECGGPVAMVPELALALAHRGHKVTVLTADLGLGAHPEVMVEPFEWGWRAYQENVQVIYLPTLWRYHALTLNSHLLEFCRTFLRQVDMVHCYGLYDLLGPAASFFCRRQGIPYLIEPMGMSRPIDRSFRIKRLWHRSLGDRHWRDAALIVATSELEQRELLEDGVPPERVVLRYVGIGSDVSRPSLSRGRFRSKWGIPPHEPLILFLSRLIPRKGADLLIEVFAQACPEAGWLVIAGPEGEAGYCARLQKLALGCVGNGRVVFTGPVYDEEKLALLRDADLFILPSRYENFAIAAAEAMACDVPVILSENCGICSLVNERAGLVVPLNKEALSGALHRMLSDTLLYTRFKKGCREVLKQLSWEQLAREMEGHYNQALVRSERFSIVLHSIN